MIKLSELPDNAYVYSDSSLNVIYVEALKEQLETYPEMAKETYYTTVSERFRFDAQSMIENALEDYEVSGDGYEDMADQCLEDIEPQAVRQIQQLLDQVTLGSDRFVVYVKDELIDIHH